MCTIQLFMLCVSCTDDFTYTLFSSLFLYLRIVCPTYCIGNSEPCHFIVLNYLKCVRFYSFLSQVDYIIFKRKKLPVVEMLDFSIDLGKVTVSSLAVKKY